jgi:hypothetical protein
MVCDCASLASETALLSGRSQRRKRGRRMGNKGTWRWPDARVRRLRATATRIRAREPWVLRARRGIGRKAPEVSVSCLGPEDSSATVHRPYSSTQPASLYMRGQRWREKQRRRTMCSTESQAAAPSALAAAGANSVKRHLPRNVDGRAPFQLQTIVVTNRDAKYCHVSHNAQHQA